MVLSYDTENGEAVPGAVVHLFVHPHTTQLVRLNDKITTTPEHRFYANGSWIAAGNLGMGDALLGLGGLGETGGATVATTGLATFTGDVTTYNFEVATYHDYFAGGVLVHNIKAPCQ
jgi:hypothetical protein